MSTYKGPCEIECPLKCRVPEGWTVTEMPPSRHAWSDIIRCPNDDCDRTLLATRST